MFSIYAYFKFCWWSFTLSIDNSITYIFTYFPNRLNWSSFYLKINLVHIRTFYLGHWSKYYNINDFEINYFSSDCQSTCKVVCHCNNYCPKYFFCTYVCTRYHCTIVRVCAIIIIHPLLWHIITQEQNAAASVMNINV